VSRRIQIVLPDPAADLLIEYSAAQGTPPSTFAAQLVRERLQDLSSGPSVTTRPRASLQARNCAQRPTWLEPYGGSRAWRAETWGAIVALHARYPRSLGALKDGWWDDQAHVETLCALAAWRAQIDARGQEPREEFAFHAQLADYADVLKAEGGGVEHTWHPGAPPAGWTA